MPNYVQYSTSNLTGSLRKGNVALGVTTASIAGPTSTTNWYTGITPATGKYVIYKTAATGDPDIFCPQTDQELFNFVLMQGGSSSNITSVSASLAWIGTQTNLVAANFDYENIVTDGLVLNLDAGFLPSYPTTSSNWYDLSGNVNNGTLINNPTFASANSGSLTFNGSNQYSTILSTANIPSGNSQYTLSIWFNAASFGSGGFIGWGDYGQSNKVTALRFNNNGFVHYWWGNDLFTNLNLMNTNTWYNVVALFDGTNRQIWLNGTKLSEDTPSGHNVTNTSNITIGVTNTNEYFSGKIGNVLVYNKGLSLTEVAQNYNSQRSRFGV